MSGKLSLTRQILAKMLKENTGIHCLDSGMQSGRHWQRNQNRNFETEKPINLTINQYGIEYVRNVYHFLADNLEYSPSLNNSLYAFERSHTEEFRYDSWYEIVQKWVEKKGYVEGIRENTCNGENNLSQDFVFSLLSTDNSVSKNDDIYSFPYIILEIHGGADVRGGYTLPKIFELKEDNFFMRADGTIGCDNDRDHYWSTDDNYHWYFQGSCGYNAGKQLETYERVDLEEVTEEVLENPEYQAAVNDQMIIDDSQIPLWADYRPSAIHPVNMSNWLDVPENPLFYKDNIGYCPICYMEQKKLSPLIA